MKHQALATSIGIVFGTTLLAFTAGVLAASATGAETVAASAAAAAVLGAAWVVKRPEGVASFGIAVLLSDTLPFWTGVEFRFLDELALILVPVSLLVLRRDGFRFSRPGPRAISLVVFVAAGVISSLVAGVPSTVWLPGLLLVGKGFIFFYLIAMSRIEPHELPRVTVPVFLAAVVIAAIGIAQFIGGDAVRGLPFLPPYDRERAGIEVVGSLFSHPAIYGWITVYTALFLMARFTVTRDWMSLGLAVVLSPASLLSGRRTPIVGLFAGVLTLIARQITGGRGEHRRLIPVVGIVLLGILASSPVLVRLYDITLAEYVEPPELVAEIFDDSPDSRVLRDMAPRNALYLGSVVIARDHAPLGAGFGRFGSHMSREIYSPLYAEYGLERIYGLSARHPIAITDTYWPMVLGEAGIIGLVAIASFMAILLRDLWRFSGRIGAAGRWFTLGALLVFVDGLVRSLTSGVFAAPPIGYFVLGAAGLAVAIASTDVSTAEAPPPEPR